MRSTSNCPLCSDSYRRESDLHVHLEVEHRKSELARYVVERDDSSGDPIAERGDSAEVTREKLTQHPL